MATINSGNTKKKDIAKNIFLNIGISSFYASKIINDLINILISSLFLNKSLKIKNFGSFKLKKKKKEEGKNKKKKKNKKIKKKKKKK